MKKLFAIPPLASIAHDQALARSASEGLHASCPRWRVGLVWSVLCRGTWIDAQFGLERVPESMLREGEAPAEPSGHRTKTAQQELRPPRIDASGEFQDMLLGSTGRNKTSSGHRKAAQPTTFQRLHASASARRRRSGFSLLEVILATAILLACLIVLGQMSFVGMQNAEDAADVTTAQLICRTKLNEILIDAVPLASVDSQPVADNPGWVYSVEVEPMERLGLVTLRVSVSRQASELSSSSTEIPGQQFTLTRWLHAADREDDESFDFDWPEASPFGSLIDGDLLP